LSKENFFSNLVDKRLTIRLKVGYYFHEK